MKKVVFILGPTAVGKTYFSVKLAKELDGEIVSADSVQIYKGLDIGSAKVTKEEMQGVKHYAIDILEPEEDFSVYDFIEYTKKKIDEIIAKGKTPIVVGGTALYVKALTLGYNFGGASYDKEQRQKIEKMLAENGLEHVYNLLKETSPAMAESVDRHNPVRVVRALEIALSGGKKTESKTDIDGLLIALSRDRQKLYDDINRRVDIMLENGLVDEVKGLMERGLTLENQCMKAIDYKEVYAFLKGEYDYDRMVELLKQHSRNYAKRQMTFLRGMQNIHFVNTEDREKAFKEILKLVEEWKR